MKTNKLPKMNKRILIYKLHQGAKYLLLFTVVIYFILAGFGPLVGAWNPNLGALKVIRDVLYYVLISGGVLTIITTITCVVFLISFHWIAKKGKVELEEENKRIKEIKAKDEKEYLRKNRVVKHWN